MGIPSAPIVTKAFKDLAILNAAKSGMPHERICFTQHPVWGKTPDELRVYVDGQDPVNEKPFMKEVVDALTVPLSDEEKKSGIVSVSVGPPTFTDTAENLQDFYLNNGYTDFLPDHSAHAKKKWTRCSRAPATIPTKWSAKWQPARIRRGATRSGT